MPRPPRFIEAHTIYHIVCRGNNGQQIFRSDRDFKVYLALLDKCRQKHPAPIFHYCLMPNHLHVLLRALTKEDLSKLMQKTNLSYALHYKRVYAHSGHLFQDRFRSVPITSDAQLLVCGRYIEMNPVRAGLVDDPGQYRFSSFRFYARGATELWITPNPLFLQLGSDDTVRRTRFKEFVLSDVETEMARRLLRSKGSFCKRGRFS